jgi:hypothetical protein
MNTYRVHKHLHSIPFQRMDHMLLYHMLEDHMLLDYVLLDFPFFVICRYITSLVPRINRIIFI